MDSSLSPDGFRACLDRFNPGRFESTRALALYSAAIALSDEDCLVRAVSAARRFGATNAQVYEVLLQSYLFLGFPRMLIAAGHFGSEPPEGAVGGDPDRASMQEWYPRGLDLCRKVYGANFERLRSRVEKMAPEVFQWMLLEGYGKVLSRPVLAMPAREAAIVSCLIVDNRPTQLHSHARGALNVGTPPELLVDVVQDLGPEAGEGYRQARSILERLKVL